MHPKLKHEAGSRQKLYTELKSSIESFECSKFISDLIAINSIDVKGKQKLKNLTINKFRKELIDHLKKWEFGIDWKEEFIIPNPESHSARCDIYGVKNSTNIVIEMDAWRADQVSKKFVSRCALFSKCELIYISLCYVGTNGMNPEECTKYLGYCADLAKRLGCNYAGFITE